MEYQITSSENWHQTILFTIPASDVKPELDTVMNHFAQVRVEGFRKGKVPLHLVKKMFGKKAEAEAFSGFISKSYDQFFKENEFDILNTPEIREIKFDESTGLTFELHFDIRPKITVTGYQGMPVEKEVFEAGEENVKNTLARMQEQNAMVYTVEGEAQSGHYLVTDLQETDRGGVPLLGKKYENQIILLSEDNPEVNAQLTGIKAGEERRIVLAAKQEKSPVQPETAETEKYFLALVKEIRERKLPELDDEFAKDVGPYQTLDELVKDVENRLQQQAKWESIYHFRRALADELIKRMKIEVPPSMLETYLAAVVRDVQTNNKSKVDEAQIREYYKSSAIRTIKWILIREQLIQKLGIEISDEDLENRLHTMAGESQSGEKRVQEIRNNAEQKQRLKEDMEEERVYDFLASQAAVTEVKKPWRADEHQHDHDHE